MPAYDNIDNPFAGLLYGIAPKRISTFVAALENMDWGEPVFGYEGDDVNGYKLVNDTNSLTLDADLVTSNVYTITIKGTVIATTYDTSMANTMNLVKANIEAEFPTATVTLSGTNNRVVTVQLLGLEITISGVVTAGASQANVAVGTASTAMVFLGVNSYTAISFQETSGVIPVGYDMNNLEEGFIWVAVSEAVQANTDAYVVASGANKGKFATSGYATNAKFRSSTTGAGLALLEVRGQNKAA